MKYRIGGIDGERECSVTRSHGNGEYTITIDGRERRVRVISADSRGMDFALDNTHHRVTYVPGDALETRMILDGLQISAFRHTGLDEIVYKNSGRSEASGGGSLKSQIPGKVVSVAVSEGDEVAEGDTICALEAMKMQVGVKAHKAGTVSALRVKVGDTVAKGAVIAEIA
ncbi:MAG: biotin/lipoyl-binding protein [Thaumarchaeota archaeon]|nr:biotin/lipoyl-binding protein [Nitrososphaerota archaeon]MDD9809904.1 biotin/lipoyl-binding protein [Nitrososphaerota archaeon]MDD9813947.1 biotin/lipoyl-binding protein [Nitrososphaerota archaeon]MDD9825489.1 biotin/lipoyl-binding protein [Nitrososphaerota archaeon]RNJ74178.1 MAG: acetyl-CoA carboxylase biotin carboxyl carrier protein subunit [Thaumarchaeota archaeon S14]